MQACVVEQAADTPGSRDSRLARIRPPHRTSARVAHLDRIQEPAIRQHRHWRCRTRSPACWRASRVPAAGRAAPGSATQSRSGSPQQASRPTATAGQRRNAHASIRLAAGGHFAQPSRERRSRNRHLPFRLRPPLTARGRNDHSGSSRSAELILSIRMPAWRAVSRSSRLPSNSRRWLGLTPEPPADPTP